ncbi:lycopene cyclase domain-containing protein [Actinotalea sp. BY-33]|uniref:Lycopene cyclase domain-containing protein n=1 Tax=Actinotalea soli TaxID=2819234 RepID=A0A939LQI3_9CELL|nr:lycopene cyclase domain-containing protein [Actinotalea soli]MBO1752862.1 lycopene cyclase domain-containing protein [Actinotalea soli]
MTYLVINAIFLPVALAVLGLAWWWGGRRAGGAGAGRAGAGRVRTRPSLRALGITTVVLLVMTAVFDNLMIRSGLVAYDDEQRIGWSIGVAPIEDFAYSVAAVLLLPALWHLLGRRRREDEA